MKIFNFLKNFTFSDVSRGIEPVEKCSDQPTDDVFGSFGDGFGQSHQEPNAVSTEQTTLLQRNAVNCVQIAAQPKAGPCQTITRFTAPLESVRLRFLQQTVNKTGCCFPAKFFPKSQNSVHLTMASTTWLCISSGMSQPEVRLQWKTWSPPRRLLCRME